MHEAGCCKCEGSLSRIRECRGQTSAARYVRSCDDEGLQLNDKVGGYECVNWSCGEMKKLKFTVQHLWGTS